MSVESLWYMSFSGGEPPPCRRLSRMDMQFQFQAAIEIAIAFSEGNAGYRGVSISMTGETYWYWIHPESESGWWLIPHRVDRRTLQLVEAATSTAIRPTGSCSNEDIARVLRAWRKSGHWRRLISEIYPRHPEPNHGSYARWIASLGQTQRKPRGRPRKQVPAPAGPH